MRGPLWLIVKHENSRMAVLTVDDCGGETLPVFSYEEEAEAYLWLAGQAEVGWRARKTTAGELISVLYGPCAGAKKVALDPLPAVGGATMVERVSLGRERFMQSLMNRRESLAIRRSPLRTGVSAGSDPSESLAKKGARMRESEDRRERTQSQAAARYELERRSYLESTPHEEDGAGDGVAIPDYVTMDFGSPDGDGLSEDSDGRRRMPEIPGVNERLVQDRE